MNTTAKSDRAVESIMLLEISCMVLAKWIGAKVYLPSLCLSALFALWSESLYDERVCLAQVGYPELNREHPNSD